MCCFSFWRLAEGGACAAPSPLGASPVLNPWDQGWIRNTRQVRGCRFTLYARVMMRWMTGRA